MPGGENGGHKIVALELVRRLARFAPETQFLILTSASCHDELAALEAKNVSRKLIGVEAKWQSRARRWGGRVRRTLMRRVPGRFRPAVYEFQRVIWRTAGKASLGEDLNVDLLFCPFGTAHLRGRAGLRPELPIAAIVIDLQHKAYPQFFNQDQITERDHDLNWHRTSVIGVGSDFVRQSLLDEGFSESSVRTIYIRLNRRLPELDHEHASSILRKLKLAPESVFSLSG